MEDLYAEYNFPSAQRFYAILRENGEPRTHKEVREFIEKQAVAQVLKKKYDFTRNKQKPIFAMSADSNYQVDLIDYYKYGTKNKNFKFILVCVDVFSRKAYGESIKDKTPLTVATAFKKILADNQVQPKSIFHDHGNEFKGDFAVLMKSLNIMSLENDLENHRSLGVIDRFCRTIKSMISKYMTANNTGTYIHVLPKLIKLYNETPHTEIADIKPAEATDTRENRTTITGINDEKREQNRTVNKQRVEITHQFFVGDSVRIQKKKGTFTKGYVVSYSPEVYKIVKTTHLRATLDDGKEYSITSLLKVPEGSVNLPTTNEEHTVKKARQKRLMNKEGLAPAKNIIEKRITRSGGYNLRSRT